LVFPHRDLRSGDTSKSGRRSPSALATCLLHFRWYWRIFSTIHGTCSFRRMPVFLCLSSLVKPKSGVQHLIRPTSQFAVYVLLTNSYFVNVSKCCLLCNVTQVCFCFYSNFFVTVSSYSPVALKPNTGHGLFILKVSRSHTTAHHSR
jgi:hypothetical protein